MNFEGKTALVTGAATLFFAERGVGLVLDDMNYEKLKDVKKRPKNRARMSLYQWSNNVREVLS